MCLIDKDISLCFYREKAYGSNTTLKIHIDDQPDLITSLEHQSTKKKKKKILLIKTSNNS